MASAPYFGTYCRFESADRKSGALLLGADNLVGDSLSIEFEQRGASSRAWLVNRFGARVGYVDAAASEQLALCQARGWELRALLVSVYYADEPKPGAYWGEAALVCFAPRHRTAFDTFCERVGQMLAQGVRVDVDLGQKGVESLLEADGQWLPTQRVARLDNTAGSVLLKDHVSLNEKLVELARSRNIGCMVVGWGFILAALALLAWVVRGHIL